MNYQFNFTYTYRQFEKAIGHIVQLIERDTFIERLSGNEVIDSPAEDFVIFLAGLFPENLENYKLSCDNYEFDFYDFWDNWQDMVECAITSFVWGVVDCHSKEIAAPHAHDLLTYESVSAARSNDTSYSCSLHSIEILWRICTGEIPVRERFS